jgi:hypothetical protein
MIAQDDDNANASDDAKALDHAKAWAPAPEDLLAQAAKRWSTGYEAERENISQAYEDLRFRAGDQWPKEAIAQREADQAPCLTINRIPQFVRQVTGDIRQGRPSIKVVPVDDGGDEAAAELRAGIIRYIENRCDAPGTYFSAADSQVNSGIGHWRVITEYASQTTFNQEIGIQLVQDGVSVVWDPDAVDLTRKDAMWCFVPVDIAIDAYKEKYPDAPVTDFSTETEGHFEGWVTTNTVRVAEYFYKKPARIRLALTADGTIRDVTEAPAEELAKLAQQGARIDERDSFKIYRCLITQGHILEKPTVWPGRYIPIVPLLGEEIRIGPRVIRHGIVRFARDPQRMFNYFASKQAEVIALQPKAPWLGTERNFEEYEDEWENANTESRPYLRYTPDPSNGNAAPQRVQPPVSSQGVSEGLQLAAENMMAVIGIHQAGLGEASNEKSGRAILARQREGDVGTFVYLDNFARAVRHTGVILLDLIPHIYDTERTIRIVGEDGRMTPLRVNQAVGMVVGGEGDDGETATAQKLNDLSVGAYDVVIEQGPSYSTKREEAKDGMATLVQAVPSTFGLIGDLYVQAQDWPMKDQIAKRLKMGLPPAIQQMEAQGSGAPPSPQPEQPSPEVIAAQQQAEAQGARIQMDGAKTQSQIATEEQQRRIDLARAQSNLADAENARAIAAREAENAARRTEAEIALIEARRALALAQIGALGRGAGQAGADMTMVQHDAALREAQAFAADTDGL